MVMSKVLLGTILAAGLALGASHAAGAQWHDSPMGPGMMDPGSAHPACTDDDHGVWPGMGMYPDHDNGMMPGCVWDDDWWDD